MSNNDSLEFDPYSVQGLRFRALRIKEKTPYKLILELAADQLDEGKITRDEVITAINLVRFGGETLNPMFVAIGIKKLKPNRTQIDVMLHLLGEK